MKERRIKIVISAVIAIICLLVMFSSRWTDSYIFSDTSENIKADCYQNLENNELYQIKFFNVADGIEKIVLRFHLPDNVGNLTLGISDLRGHTTLWEGTFDLSQFSVQELAIPLLSNDYSEEMEFGKWYTINIQTSNREELDPVKFHTTDSYLSLEIYAERYFQWPVMLLELVLGLVFICITWCPQITVNKAWEDALISVGIACVGYIIVEYSTTNLTNISLKYTFANIFFIFLFIKLLQVFIHDVKITGYIVLPLCALIGALAYYVNLFRGSPLVPWDIYALDTAMAVVDQYEFSFENNLRLAICLCIFSIFLLSKLNISYVDEGKLAKAIRKKLCINSKRVLACVKNIIILLCGLVIAWIGVYPSLQTSLWDVPGIYNTQGFIASYIAYAKYLHIDQPKGYSKEKAEAILEKYAPEANPSHTQANNIIFVMNETYADMRMINNELVGDEYMPFWDSLQENTVKGKLYVPVFGGGTCDSEFEALTGLSTKYTGPNPYVCKINTDVDSLAQELLKQGYQTIALHPYKIENWNRNNVYPLLGFQEVYGINNMAEQEIVRWTISDQASYREIIRYYENKTSENLFVFNVTIQNHAAYSEEWENLQNTANLSHIGDFPQAEQYLSLIKLSDQALEELIAYFSNVDEPTLICVFGDHQPVLEEEYYEYLFGKQRSSLSGEEALEQYSTPFLIWANYDLPEIDDEIISANYLRAKIKQYAGLEQSGIDAFLTHLSKEYPVITTHGIIDKNGVFYKSLESELLDEYHTVCYYIMKGE